VRPRARHDVPVARVLGTSTAVGLSAPAEPVPAARVSRPGWRDPRLWVGVAIVAASVVAGARLMASADDTVGVWALSHDAGRGEALDADDLVLRQVRLPGDTMSGYFAADDPLPTGTVLDRPIGAGARLPRTALVTSADAGLVDLPISVDPEQVPPQVHAGATVDVYAVGERATPVLRGVTVVSISSPEDSFASSGDRQVVLAVPQRAVDGFFSTMAGDQPPTLTVVGRTP
jgi:hypothetical protein